jgi:phosphoribosylamine---glycine ligase
VSVDRHPVERGLLIGKDARTDAIAEACLSSSGHPDLSALAEIRSPGLVEKCNGRVSTGDLTDHDLLARVVHEVDPDLAIVGPEEPLEAGFVDVLRSLDVPAFGPTAELAQIETSKSWTRGLLDRNRIPGNPEYQVFTSSRDLLPYMRELPSFVIKPDGLTAGKGVRVFGEHLHSLEEAAAYAESLLREDGRVQIEERLEGEEFSLQTITDGESFIHLPLVQDHKRAYENDEGPNTGGMGSYSCPDFSLPFLAPEDVALARSINQQVVEALGREVGEPYRGVLYGGFMAVSDGIRLIEYNARFGDPEAMNVLPVLRADFFELCKAVCDGRLRQTQWSFEPKATVCKYIVPQGYPGTPARGERIIVPDEFRNRNDLKWYWAACEKKNGDAELTSSRSGAVVGIGDSLEEAEQTAEEAARAIEETNHGAVRHRSDIGRSNVVEARVRHVESLRETALSASASAT